MDYKLIDIPNFKLDEIINSKIEKSEKILIVVSFIFTKGLDLFFSKLKEFKHKENITIITSNYLNCTEPSALRKLLELKKLGANIYFFDATKSKENFHIKSYNFENKNKDFFSSIIGSSNISYSAFKQSHELNVEINNQVFFEENKKKLLNFLTHDFLFTLNEKVIEDYEKYYVENDNFIKKNEENTNEEGLNVLNFIKPNFAQIEALKKLEDTRNENNKKGLVVMATGLGKTILSALDVSAFKANKVLFVAHREEILTQSKSTFEKFIPNKKYGIYKAGKKNINDDYIFASIQTIGKSSELEKFKKNNFDYIIIDEFHHVGARSYKRLVEYFEPKFFLGLTATPNRTDNIDIMQFCGDNLIYKKDLIDGINLKILCNFDYKGIADKYVDYTKITWRGKKFDEAELDKNLNKSNRAEYIYQNWVKHKQTRTLAFCASIKHCEFMEKYFLSKGTKAVSVHSQSGVNRGEAIRELTEKKIDIIFSVDLFNEGVDIPSVDTILMLRPTESKIIFIQQFGRGLRKSDGKEFVQVIDFIGNHKTFLEKPAALFNFDLSAKEMGSFLKNYKHKTLNLPQDSRIFYDPETLDFFKKYSLKMNKEEFIKFEDGDLAQTPESQIHKAFNKTDVYKLFKYTEAAANPDVYKMFGHVRPKGVKEQFIFVNLIKQNFAIQYQYQDYFKSNKLLHWQSTKGTKESNVAGQEIINHKKTGKDIHLFVRTSTLAGRKFLYCGKVNFLNGKGDGPFDVDFELETPLPNKISEEFVRVGI
jgi:superfamily II DNA or RNA helicase